MDHIDSVHVKSGDDMSVTMLKFCWNLNAIKWNILWNALVIDKTTFLSKIISRTYGGLNAHMTHGANNNVFDPYGIPYALEIGVLKTNLSHEWVLNPEHRL